ncbi:putative uncharacterized protein [Methylocaldum marinum]|jgi:hypothetical protein|uniref:Acyl carrier protein n=1 Tax=Methylocaldum marinum TaxID=1432792 RepID=A0A250KSA1_9GAMM|nr:hypothetical protein [Methylocaldum marinum]BBA34426.1 putative uncharacterized protein [Methylocaldum marinum]
MKNVTENESMLPSKDQAIETIIDIFVREIGFIERSEVSRSTHIVKDFYIDTDDISWFAEAVEKHFGLNTPPGEWPKGFAPTIEGIADYVLYHLSKNKVK